MNVNGQNVDCCSFQETVGSKYFAAKNVSPYETDPERNVIKCVVGAFVARRLFSKPVLLLTSAVDGSRGSHNAPFSSQRRRLRTGHCKKFPDPTEILQSVI